MADLIRATILYIQTPVLIPKHLLAAMSEPNEFHKSAWPRVPF